MEKKEQVPSDASCVGEAWVQEPELSYYYGSFRIPSRIFADEVDKQKMLGILGDESENRGVDILAFSLTDDQLKVLLCENGENASEEAEDFLEQLGDDFDGYFGMRGMGCGAVREHLNWTGVEQRHVLNCCSYIHADGTQKGYTKRGLDYWWSSYVSYCGIYDWKFVKKDLLLEQFSVDPDDAYTLFTGRGRRGRHCSYRRAKQEAV